MLYERNIGGKREEMELVYRDKKRNHELYRDPYGQYYTRDGSYIYHKIKRVYVVEKFILAARFGVGDRVYYPLNDLYGEITGVNVMVINDKPYLTYITKMDDGTYENLFAGHIFLDKNEYNEGCFTYSFWIDIHDGSKQNKAASTYTAYGLVDSCTSDSTNYGNFKLYEENSGRQ